jgi:glycopeptide antibiotics resistance protein
VTGRNTAGCDDGRVLSAVGLWDFVTGPAPLTVLAVTAVATWPATRWIARRTGCRRPVAALFVATVGMVVALTLTPNDPVPGVPVPVPPHFLEQIGDTRLVWSLLTAAPADAEQVANIALYLPVGFLGRLVWRRVGPAALTGLALTAAIETCQFGIIGRAGSITDIRNNTAGALLGAVVAAVAAGLARRARPGPAD